MQRIIQLTEEEYQELLSVQNKPNVLLEKTLANYKEKLRISQLQCDSLNQTLSMYAASGASIRKPQPSNISTELTGVITLWNLETSNSIKERSILVSQYPGSPDPSNIRGLIRDALKQGLIARTKDLTLKEVK